MFHVEQAPPSEWLSDQLRELWFGLGRLGFPVDEEQKARFSTYLSLLWLENQKINLFSKNDVHRLVSRHVLESIGWLGVLNLQPSGRWVDIGSGAGFPGIPLKIMFPEMKLVLVESIEKKALFLRRMIRKLELASTMVLCERAEVLSKQRRYRNQFRFGTARAVSSLTNLIRWTDSFFAPGGHLFLIKGGDLSDEIKRVQNLVQKKKIRLKIYNYFIDFITDVQSVPERKIVDVEFLK